MSSLPSVMRCAGAVRRKPQRSSRTWVLNKKYVYFNDEDDANETKYLEKPPSTLLTLDPYATFTSMVQRYGGGIFFEFAQVH
jgi:hypothetical protein